MHKYVLPTYSPVRPNTSIFKPPTINITVISEYHPSTAEYPIINLLTINTSAKMKPIIDKHAPHTSATLKGFTENAVNPFIHKATSFLKE